MKATLGTWLSHTYHEGRVLFGPESFLLVVVAVYVTAITIGIDERQFITVHLLAGLFAFGGTIVNVFRLGRLSLPRRIALWLLVIADVFLGFLFTSFFSAFSVW